MQGFHLIASNGGETVPLDGEPRDFEELAEEESEEREERAAEKGIPTYKCMVPLFLYA